MKKPKTNKEQKLKEDINILQDKLQEVTSNNNWHKSILKDIAEFIGLSVYFNSSTSIESLKREIASMVAFKKMHEGAYHPLQDTITTQREIIRWLIKPSTAEKPNGEIIEEYRKKGLL